MDFSMMSYLVLLFVLLRNISFHHKLLKGVRFFAHFLALLIIFCQVVLAFADAELSHFWGSRFNKQALDYLKNTKEAMAGSGLANHTFIWTVSLIISLILFFVWIKKIFGGQIFDWKRDKEDRKALLNNHFWYLGMFPLYFLLLRGGVGPVTMNQSRVYYSSNRHINLAALNGLWNASYYLMNKAETVKLADYYHKSISPASNALRQYLGEKKVVQSGKMLNEGKNNVLIIMLESFSAYTSKYFGALRDFTPQLDRWAQKGWSFTSCYAAGDRTDKGLAAVLSAWPGQPWQSILHEPDKASKLPSLHQMAANQGYQTAFYYGGDAGFANMSAYLKLTGTQNIVDKSHWPSSSYGSKWGVHDEFLYQKLLLDITHSKKPFFITALTLSSHEPFEVPNQKGPPGANEYQKFSQSVYYADHCLGSFLDQFSKTKAWKNTLVVLVADHGRDYGIDPQGHFKEPVKFKIPLIITGGALNPSYEKKVTTKVVSQLDIASTIAECMWNQTFPYSRNLNREKHPSIAAYLFDDGIGVISQNGFVILENHPQRVGKKEGDAQWVETLEKIGWELQYHLIENYLKM